MENNQYFISTTPFESPKNGISYTLGDLQIWVHKNLDVTEFKTSRSHLILLGFIFHSTYPQKSNFEILQNLGRHSISSMDFFNYFNQLTGRFVLLARENNKTVILNDPAGQRQVFYTFQDELFYATSSPKLFYNLTDFEFQIPEEKLKIIKSKRFRLLEEWFPGDEYLDTKLKRLLPNFLIELERKILKRIPFQVQKFSKKDLKEYIFRQIQGAMEASAHKFDHTLLAVTAGSDSRLILNCTPQNESIKYFLFKRESENDTDLKIAKKLTDLKRINLSVIEPPKLSNDFLANYKKQFLHSRVLLKLRNIEWLQNNYKEKNAVVIIGYAGEILRRYTQSNNIYQKKFTTKEDLTNYLHYGENKYLDNATSKWFDFSVEYMEKCDNLLLVDLFYWEQVMESYCAQYTYEQDFSGVEVFCPLSNRQMILNLIHNTTAEERSAPNGIIYQIINETSPEWKDIPYNPKSLIKKLKDTLFNILPLRIVNRLINR